MAMISVNQKTNAHKMIVPSTAETLFTNLFSRTAASSFVAKLSFSSLRQRSISWRVSSPLASIFLLISLSIYSIISSASFSPRRRTRKLRISPVEMFDGLSIKNRFIIYGLYFLIMIDALCPPKPKVLLKAAFTSLSCALLKVKFNFGSKAGSSVK